MKKRKKKEKERISRKEKKVIKKNTIPKLMIFLSCFFSVDPPAFLNTEKAELLFIGASDDLVEEFGRRGQELEELEKKDMAGATKNKLFEELRLSPEEFPPEPLLKGTWA